MPQNSSPKPRSCPPGHARVHLLHAVDGSIEAARFLLSPVEQERASRFRFKPDAEAWIGWRAGLRQVLASYLGVDPGIVPIHSGQSGKPQLADPSGLHFNLSHSRHLAVVIISGDGPVGIDIEPLDRASSLPDCRHEFCHPAEIAALPADQARLERELLEIWVAKEALLKGLGTGLGFPPQQLQIVGDQGCSEPALEGLDHLKVATPFHPSGHLLAAAVPRTVDHFELVDD